MSDTRRFFDVLFERKPDELPLVAWYKNTDGSKRTSYLLSAERAEQDALAAAPTADVYAGVGLAPHGAHKDIGPRRRPSKSQLAGIVGLWADIDVNGGPENKRDAAPDQGAAVAVAEALLEPTMLVFSGYGVQAWWLFDEPWLFGDSNEERAGAQELAAKWQRALVGAAAFDLDATHDPTRVLRVPGTINHKGGLGAAVSLLHLNTEQRYDLDDFQPFTADIQLTLAPTANGTGPADEIVVTIRPDAQPPLDKFEALRDADELFASAWKRERPGEPKTREWSASEWDMALADRTVRARWNDQEVTDLLVYARNRHGDDLKRPDYYARTIARVRATIEVGEAEQHRRAAIEELTAPAVSADDRDPTHVLALFEQVVGVKLASFVQYGRDPDEGGTFELVLAGPDAGRRVRFPNFGELVEPLKFRNRIATATSTLPERVKGDEWDKVIRRMLEIVEVHDSPNETSIGVLDDWLANYIGNVGASDRAEALRAGYPHEHDGKLYVNRSHFGAYLKTRFGETMRRRDLTALLKAAGFRGERVPYRRADGASTTTHLYARALEQGQGT